jgi:hypothetical protein
MKAEKTEQPDVIQTAITGKNAKVWLRENIEQVTKEEGEVAWRYDEYALEVRDRQNLEQYLIDNFDVLVMQAKQAEADALVKDFTTYLDQYIDSVAQTKGYDNRITASLRAAATESPWYAEGVAFVTWMDTCYTTAYQVLGDAQNGLREIPTKEELIDELPEMVWP